MYDDCIDLNEVVDEWINQLNNFIFRILTIAPEEN